MYFHTKDSRLNEFGLIRRYFSTLTRERADVVLGVGDDCALLEVPPDQQLAVTVDSLVAGVHFLADCDPEALGHKVLAVSLSDLAAMGAQPAWATLALVLPALDEAWLGAFSRGLAALANAQGVQLVGGDTSRGPLSITLQLQGLVPRGRAITRAGARPGELLCVTGRLGDAGLALRRLQQGQAAAQLPGPLRRRLERPEPRVAAGLALRGLASSAIDVSDGLLADLGHILEASGVGGELELARLPLSAAVREALAETGWELPLSAGDDYELCFSLPADRWGEVEAIGQRLGLAMTRIGRIETSGGLRCRLENGGLWRPEKGGYDHFAP